MRKALLFIIITTIMQSLSAQHRVVRRWDARFGSDSSERFYQICQVKDGGYILGGISNSGINGNKTQVSNGDIDFWIVKADINGNYLWDRSLGGSNWDGFEGVCATQDGGCIVGGFSESGISGDMTQPSRGYSDMWIVKLDAAGHQQWDKRYGGNDVDEVHTIIQTRDGGYFLGGSSTSDISGDKTESNWGGFDYWVVKIDSNGTKQWDKRFGSISNDGLNDVIQTPDGGYLLGGYSYEWNTSGDKTQPNFDANSGYWIVKIDSVGHKQWDKVFGGVGQADFGNALNTRDGNYLLGGSSYDGISGSKTVANCGFWLVKIDTAGNQLNDWAFGTGVNCLEAFGSMSATADGGYLLTGISGGRISGDKTENNLGAQQVWTIKIDSQMHKVWDKTSLTLGDNDKSAGALESSPGCYVIGAQTYAGIGGDKTQNNWNRSFDYWIVQYCDTILTGITETAGDIHFSIYPNPTAGEISITLERDNLKEAAFTLTNISGQLIYQSTETNLARSYTKMLDIHTLPAGVYLLEIIVDGQRISRRVVKD